MNSLPPSLSRSVASSVTPSAFSASLNTDTVPCERLGHRRRARPRRAVRRCRRSGRSAIVATLCSGSGTPLVQVVAEREREQRPQPVAGRSAGTGSPSARGRRDRPPPQEQGTVLARPRATAGAAARRCPRVTTISPASAALLGLGRRGGRRAEDEQLAGRCTDEEEVDRAGVDADRHRQPQPADRGRDRRGLAQRRRACRRRRAQARSAWSVAAEGEQQRVAAELQQLAAADSPPASSMPPKTRLRVSMSSSAPMRPASGEPLGEGGEAGDVGEDQGARRRSARRRPVRRRPSRGRSGARGGAGRSRRTASSRPRDDLRRPPPRGAHAHGTG